VVNEIILGDCLEVMKQIPDKSIDLVLTDPPYGIGESGSKNHSRGCIAETTKFTELNWDNEIPKKEIFDEIFRISKNQIIFGGNYFVEYLKNTSCFIVWDKENGATDFADCELAWTSFKTATRQFKFRWQGMLQGNMKNKEKRYHPTQKPIELFRRILNDYSEEGMTILDPFAGSGTTAIACHDLKRNFICIEKEPEYHRIATERYETHKAQLTLF
jgi:site-specific DNA-methyltransferase (adenine-specific)